MAQTELPGAEIAARYKAGESTHQLGRAYGMSHWTISKRLHAEGVRLRFAGRRHRPGGPLHNSRGYLRTRDRRGRVCFVHRACWEAHYGPIPNGCVVHHCDEDRLNNAIENLACMTHGEHSGLHNMDR